MAEDDVYEAAPGVLVVRLSRTSQGQRTYTVGMSLPEGSDDKAGLARLFDIERQITREIDGPRSSSVRGGSSLTSQMRRTMILNRIRQAKDWLTTNDLLEHNDSTKSRSQLVADLSVLVRDGLIEYEQGTGRHKPSRYRGLAAMGKAVRAMGSGK